MKTVGCYDCSWSENFEEWEFTPTVCPMCGGDVGEEYHKAEEVEG